MPNVFPAERYERERAVRAAIAALLAPHLGDEPGRPITRVQTRERYVDTPEQWLEIVARKVDGEPKIRAGFVYFLRVTEREAAARAGCTWLTVTYGINLYWSFDDRNDSDADFVKLIMDFGRAVTMNRPLGFKSSEVYAGFLQQTQANEVADFDDSRYTHTAGFELNVDVRG